MIKHNRILIDNMDYFIIPGTKGKYFINIDGEIYGAYKDKILKPNSHSNSIRITIDKRQKRINVKDALIEALFNYIEVSDIKRADD